MPEHDETQRTRKRLTQMGIQAKLMKGERCVIASMPLGPEPFETLAGPRRLERVVFACVGRDQIKCLRPRMLFQLPLLRIGGCRDRSDIEGRIRFVWNHHVSQLRRVGARLKSLGADVRPAEEGSLLRVPIDGEPDGVAAAVIDERRLVLPGTGRLSHRPLSRAEDRVFEISDGVETAVDLSIAASNRIEELVRMHDRQLEESRRHAILADAREPETGDKPRTHRILLVGDRITQERRVIDSLRLRGYAVECATTARKAIAAFQSCSPELVITDFELGRYEGLELIPSLRLATGIEEIPVVVVDDKSRKPRREAAQRVRAAGYLTYPIHIPRIAGHLETLIARPKRRRFTRFQRRVSVRHVETGASWVATALGRGGLFLATDSELPANRLHDLELRLPETGRTLRVRSEVLYRTTAGGREGSGIGARFDAFADGDEATLIQYLATL